MIETRDLQRHFALPEGVIKAVDNVSVTIEDGEFIAVMGPSGSGKSTLLYILGGMDTPTKGWVSIDGARLDQMNDAQRSRFRNAKLGFVFQSFHLLPRLNLLRNIEMPMLYANVPAETRRARAESLLKALGMQQSASRYPTELSGGQCQRVAIARALTNSPRLILADEPTGNLDSKTGLDIMGIFQELNRKNITIIMVTHDANMADHASRVVRMCDGTIVSDEKVKRRLWAAKPEELDI